MGGKAGCKTCITLDTVIKFIGKYRNIIGYIPNTKNGWYYLFYSCEKKTNKQKKT